METAEKKVYPSQINSKTISTRIPAVDYVKFLQESIEKGINISDWLLIKIYSEKSNKKISGLEENVIEISYKDIENYITPGESDFDDSDMIDIRKRAKNTFDFWRQYQDQCFDEDLNTFTFSEENIISIMNQGRAWYSMAMAKNKKEPSLIDVRFQVIQLLNRKNFSKADRNSFLADFDKLMEDIK